MPEPKAVPKFWKTWTLAKAAVRWSRLRDARLSVKIAMARQLANSAKITNATWPKIHKIHQNLNQNASTCIKICGINSCLCAPILELRCPSQIPQCLSNMIKYVCFKVKNSKGRGDWWFVLNCAIRGLAWWSASTAAHWESPAHQSQLWDNRDPRPPKQAGFDWQVSNPLRNQ